MYTSILYQRLHKFGAVEVVDLVPVERWLDGTGSTTLDQNCACWLSVTRFEMASVQSPEAWRGYCLFDGADGEDWGG
jgi:hypothetical protein